MPLCLLIRIFTTPLPRSGCDTKSIFKRSSVAFNSSFFFFFCLGRLLNQDYLTQPVLLVTDSWEAKRGNHIFPKTIRGKWIKNSHILYLYSSCWSHFILRWLLCEAHFLMVFISKMVISVKQRVKKKFYWIVSIFPLLCKHFSGHHYHLVMPPARISLTLSRHSFWSFILSGRSAELSPVSSQSCCM